jgi:hypothetical protein
LDSLDGSFSSMLQDDSGKAGVVEGELMVFNERKNV